MIKQYIFLIYILLITFSNSQFVENRIDSDVDCYGLIFDAGSSSTKVLIYKWDCREGNTIPQIESKEVDSTKAKPGLATFANNLEGIEGYLQPLIGSAGEFIEQNLIQYTPIMLFGTAGLRVIPEEDQTNILNEVNRIFSNSGYLYNPDWIRVITGQEEGGFLWITVNYLLDNIDENSNGTEETAVTIDLGGASTQIAYGPKNAIENDKMDLDLPSSNFEIYSVSYLGYGNDLARSKIINEYGEWSDDGLTVTTPCYHNGYQETRDDGVTIVGTGNPDNCRYYIIQSFHKEQCPDGHETRVACGINGKIQPFVPYTKDVYAINGLYYASSFFDLDEYTPNQLKDKYTHFCGKSWEQVQQENEGNPYIATQCFLGLYGSTLLVQGFNVGPNRPVISPKKIDGAKPSWTLGAMFYQVSQLPCSQESPLCQISTVLFQKYQIALENEKSNTVIEK